MDVAHTSSRLSAADSMFADQNKLVLVTALEEGCTNKTQSEALTSALGYKAPKTCRRQKHAADDT
jgi:hypothetical protein